MPSEAKYIATTCDPDGYSSGSRPKAVSLDGEKVLLKVILKLSRALSKTLPEGKQS